jgi:putative peptide zinc metalloprotease protein
MQQSARDKKAAEQVPAIREEIETFKKELAEKEQDQTRLILKAPVAGIVLPPPLTPSRDDPEERLPTWSGTPLDRQNKGARLDLGVLFCQIGDPKKLEAIMVIDGADRSLVDERQEPPQAVDIKLDGFPAPSETIHSYIKRVAEQELRVAPKRLSNKAQGELPTKTDPTTGVERPMSTSYQASAPFDDPRGQYQIGACGQGRVYTKWISLGARLWRMLTHTFNFKLGQ